MTFSLTPVASGTGGPAGGLGSFLQIQKDGVDVGDRKVSIIDIVGPTLTAKRGVGANSHVVTIRRTGVPLPAPALLSHTNANLAFGVSWVIPAPSGTEVGQLLLVPVTFYAGGQLPAGSTGWTRLHAEANTTGGMSVALFAKIATGSDSLTVSANPLSNTFASYTYFRVSGCDSLDKVELDWSEGNSTGSAVDFADLTPLLGQGDAKLWLVALSWHGAINITLATFPDGYGSTIQSAPVSSTNRVASASAAKTSSDDTESPSNGAFTGNATQYQALTICVRP